MKTINDIVREVAAEMLNTSMQEITAEVVNGWATRLGDAATAKDSLQVGNAAKMREAAGKILWCLEWMFNNTDDKSVQSHLGEPIALAKAALSAPPRNCDRFSSDEQAWDAYCDYMSDSSIIFLDYEKWLFAEAKGKVK